ncbi:hypothetical protein C2E20_3864 [Micractinium conductrix]|uniref:Uncharacterized protein n=1 Tax=Micractinium conductrix TaxID=554055 RepID=A0A2P6VFD7_9CHLO|nr:hypothetical protein C2E20_3864 [Micractinium conductrix]|eukprot:PSC72787.1 hypothetical protein C2E20_3864 [Micractinium conductrix]
MTGLKLTTDTFDDKLIIASGAAAGAIALGALAAPREWNDMHFETTTLVGEPSTRWFGLAMATNAAKTMAISASDTDRTTKKNVLKAAGAGWLGAAALTAYHVQEKVQKKDVSIGLALGEAAMGALCMWRGFKDDDDL